MHLRSLIGAATAALLTVGSAHATTLTGHLTADDAYSVYLSSDANTLGSLVSSANDWRDAETFSTGLSGGTQYLQIVVTNGLVWGGLLGDFSLSDSGYVFANGSSSLFTGLSGWTMTDANGVVRTITSAGANGTSPYPWGKVTGVANQAEWIWEAGYCEGCTYTFTTTLTATAAVPEPATGALLAAGLLTVGGLARRQRRAKDQA